MSSSANAPLGSFHEPIIINRPWVELTPALIAANQTRQDANRAEQLAVEAFIVSLGRRGVRATLRSRGIDQGFGYEVELTPTPPGILTNDDLIALKLYRPFLIVALLQAGFKVS